MGRKLEECAKTIWPQIRALLHAEEAENWDDISPDSLAGEITLNIARAVIRCLMEPSDKMLMIGSAALVETMRSSRELGESECFRAMLQSVLDEAGKE